MNRARLAAPVGGLVLVLLGPVGCSRGGEAPAAEPAARTLSAAPTSAASSAAASPPTTTAAASPPAGTAPSASPKATRTTTRAVTRTAPAQAFRSSARTVTAAQLGKSWRAGCPVGPADLRAVTVTYRGFDGAAHQGVIVVHEDIVGATVRVFRSLYGQGFPIRSIRPVSDFGASDDASMAADNTSAFNCRRAVAAGPPSWSNHAYGKAIDINPVENPYLFGGKVLPPAGAAFRSRVHARPGLIRRGDAAQRAFAAAGFRWGARFSSPDYQHFDG